MLLGLTIVFMAVIVGSFYVAQQRMNQDPVQTAARDYRRSVGGPLGLLPPRMEPVGLALTGLTIVGLIAAIVLLLRNSNALLLACGVMIICSTLATRRDREWLRNDAEYQAILAGERT
jgi:hypothetical protein